MRGKKVDKFSTSSSPLQPNESPSGSTEIAADPPDIALSIISTIAFNLIILAVCLATIILSLSSAITVPIGSWQETLAIWSIGIAVQAAFLSIIASIRTVCQIWFAHRFTTNGMSSGEMVAAWSALYSGSLRGLEDLVAGFSPIAIMLMIVLIAEIIALGSIGNLVIRREVIEVRETGNITGMGIPNSLATGVFDVGDAADLMTSSIGALIGRPYSESVMPSEEYSPSVKAECDATSGACSHISWTIPTPFNTSLLPSLYINSSTLEFTNATTPQIPTLLPNDVIETTTPMYIVNATCRPEPTLRLEYYLTTRTYWQISQTLSNGTKLKSDGAVMPSRYKSPEIGIFSLVNATATTSMDMYYLAGDELSFAVYARNFNGTFAGFTYVADPCLPSTTVGLAVCTISARKGYAATSILIKDTTPVVSSSILSVTNVTAEAIPVFNKVLTGFSATQVVNRMVGTLSCIFWSCPARGGIPWFNKRLGIIDHFPTEEQEWRDHLGRLAEVLSGVAGRVLTALSVPDVSEVHGYTILNDGLSHTLSITTPCTILLLLGSLTSSILIVFYALYPCLPGRRRSLHLGIRLTESVYSLLSSFEAPIIHARTGSNEPTMVKKALKGQVVLLNDTGSGHMGVDALSKTELRAMKEIRKSPSMGGSLVTLKKAKEKGLTSTAISTRSMAMEGEESGDL
ncbi:hypothetical protein HK097_004532 [Rhizophlyctis rosea]|uniref:Uncharacterized protein n=1 Tax=Rhizophlyctis rosea TaxID=64517 RepID=A0AAD5SG24_9FUNG|nr:hypothetical protein HK097_004532 [Rhizophlyctis rosea]